MNRPQHIDVAPAADIRSLTIFCFFCMMVFGFFENMKGITIVPIRETFDVGYTHIGAMLFISSLGYLIAVYMGGRLTMHMGYKTILVIGFSCSMTACIGFMAAYRFWIVIACFFLLNLGYGFFEVSVNSLGAKIFIKNAAVMMNITHLFYGVGSAGGPIYSAHVLEAVSDWRVVYLFAAAILLFGLLCMVRLRFPPVDRLPPDRDRSAVKPGVRFASFDWTVLLFTLALGLQVSLELGTGNWLANYLQMERGLDTVASARYLTGFFIAFTMGRLVGGFICERIGYMRTIQWFMVACIACFVAGFMVGDRFLFVFSLAGFFVSILFPTMMAVIAREYPHRASIIMGTVITGAGAVNMIANFVIGRLNDAVSISFGFLFVAVLGVVGLLMTIGLRIRLSVRAKTESFK